jgi:hypothetical protein
LTLRLSHIQSLSNTKEGFTGDLEGNTGQ